MYTRAHIYTQTHECRHLEAKPEQYAFYMNPEHRVVVFDPTLQTIFSIIQYAFLWIILNTRHMSICSLKLPGKLPTDNVRQINGFGADPNGMTKINSTQNPFARLQRYGRKVWSEINVILTGIKHQSLRQNYNHQNIVAHANERDCLVLKHTFDESPGSLVRRR